MLFLFFLWFLSISISYHRFSYYRGRGCRERSGDQRWGGHHLEVPRDHVPPPLISIFSDFSIGVFPKSAREPSSGQYSIGMHDFYSCNTSYATYCDAKPYMLHAHAMCKCMYLYLSCTALCTIHAHMVHARHMMCEVCGHITFYLQYLAQKTQHLC